MFNNSNSTTMETARTALTGISALFSVIGACLIIFSFLCIRSVRSISRCIVVIMALADISVALPALLSSIVTLGKFSISDSQTDLLCKIQSLFITTGSQASFIWTAGLAQHMFILVTFRTDPAIKRGLAVLIVLTLLVCIENVYLYTTGVLGGMSKLGWHWCWIEVDKSNDSNCYMMIWDGKLLEITSYVVVFVYYSSLYRRVQDIRSRDDLATTSVANIIYKTGKIVAIPFVFVLVRLSGTVVSLWVVAKDCHKPQHLVFDVFLTSMAFFDVSQGWINFILYFLTTSKELNVSERMKIAVRSIPYLVKKKRNHSSQNSCVTFNTSRNCATSQNSSIMLGSSPNMTPNITRNPVFDERLSTSVAKDRLLSASGSINAE